MKLEITTDFRAYPDGKNERRFKAGQLVEDLPDDLADIYVGKGLAEKSERRKDTDGPKTVVSIAFSASTTPAQGPIAQR